MQLVCAQCRRALEYSGERPSFCGYCGNPLSKTQEGTAEFAAEAPTLPPSPRPPGRETEPSTLPQTVGGYRLLRQLGSGGMGTVFEAEESSSGRHVALKLISPEFTSSKEAVERFRQEGRLASAIAHPRCVFVLAADEESGQPYIVMELMPGETLKDLVAQRGPLRPAQAVGLMVDVIEGLEEAHQHGVIHRDVKPSNCFLQADGRVKIGDFGLSKSLTTDLHLTKTGTFLGTPLFASPEQVRGDALDPRTDVYSAAATLYYLLVGRAPFQSNDAASTLARLVSDPPPPMRSLRPELPAALDRVVLRGLERQRERRWQNLDEFRAALLPFIPGKLSIGGMGIRLGAYVLDLFVIGLMGWVFIFLAMWAGVTVFENIGEVSMAAGGWVGHLVGFLPPILYYTFLEGIWGCSLGKRCLRLRVCAREGRESPGLLKALLRSCLFVSLMNGPSFVFSLLWDPLELLATNPAWLFLGPLVNLIVGIVLVTCTMRTRNGYRGPHEFLSGTRVIQLPWRRKRRLYTGGLEHSLTQPDGLPQQIGPFVVQGALRFTDQEKLLVAEDAALARKVWIWIRPASGPTLSATRRELGRASRLRWLAGAQDGDEQWDAFLAPRGSLLRDAVTGAGKLSWTEARPLLEELTDELIAAADERTLPDALTVDHVWVQPSGRVQLLEIAPDGSGLAAERHTKPTDQQAALALLGQLAVLVLEGQSRRLDAPGPVRAPLPQHAGRFLQRLLGGPRPFHKVQELQAELAATRERPTEVSAARRAGHLAVLTFLLSSGCGCCVAPVFMSPRIQYVGLLSGHIRDGDKAAGELAAADHELRDRLQQQLAHWRQQQQAWQATLSWPERQLAGFNEGLENRGPAAKEAAPNAEETRATAEKLLASEPRARAVLDPQYFLLRSLGVHGIWPALWILWAFLTRGGFSYRLTGIQLVRSDGRKAARWQCAWRALLFWLPVTFLLMSSFTLNGWFWSQGDPQPGGLIAWLPWLSMLAWAGAILMLPIYVALALWSPGRSLHDRLAGTFLVPR